jgi:two-component system sensor histidine kinase/response regulator
MQAVINRLGELFASIPLPVLEVWGRFSYLLGLALAIWAFGGFTFRVGASWMFARERQAWDARATSSIALTFVAILASGYLGSFIVLVPGAQTFESLKDLVVFLCVVLFGYPALVTVPFAYALSDLTEGVPPDFLLAWLPGYFINPACFWVAYQLIGKDPDFLRARTWSAYLLFVSLFMSVEPVLWGYICSHEFSPAVSYRSVTPALFFTTGITWALAPVAMLAALPLARRSGMFWAEIAGHVKETALGRRAATWEAGQREAPQRAVVENVLPIRMFILGPFVTLVLLMVGATAYVTLRSAERDASTLAVRLHQEISASLGLRLDDALARSPDAAARERAVSAILRRLPVAAQGRAFILDEAGEVAFSSARARDPVVASALAQLDVREKTRRPARELDYYFDHVTAQPLGRETWLAHARRYRDRARQIDWLLITALPESFYLAGVRTGNSRSALVFSVALLLSLAIAATLASIVATPLRRIAQVTRALARGDLAQRLPESRLEELDALGQSFNSMAAQLQRSFEDLLHEVEVRKTRERQLEDSEARLRASEDRLQLAIRAAKLGIWDWDVQHDRVTWDESMYQLYGVRKEDFSGAYEAWATRLLPEDLAAVSAEVDAALRGEREFAAEFRVRRGDGAVRSIRSVGQTLRDENGKPLRMVGVNWDVTEQLAAEQELRRHRDHLEDLVEQRTLALHAAKEQADAANHAKSAFLANMSHEIRTPMNAILGFGQLMEQGAELSPRDQDHLDRILSSGRHLLELINNVLEMSKIEAGRMALSLSMFDLHAAISEVCAMVRHSIEAKGLTFGCEGVAALPRHVRSDAPKLRQVLINLLGNAAKFTHAGGVTLRASAASAGERTKLRFEVQDTGVGIAPSELHKVFEPFEQTRSGVLTQGGTGLGVAISRSVARLMDGDLTVRSKLGEGTTFELEIYVESGRATQSEGARPPRGRVIGLETGQAQPTILVVDDDPNNRRALAQLLTGGGVAVVEAADGAQAVERFARHAPQLVFMDMKMPVMDGAEATRRIRETPPGRQVPIVFLSASVLESDGRGAGKGASDAFIAKPFRASDIWQSLERHLGLKLLWRHERARPESQRIKPTPAQMMALGADTIGALRAALEAGYLDRVDTLLAGLGGEHAAVAAALSHLARAFEIEALIELLPDR